VRSRYGDELYPYCKKECIRRRDGKCSGLRPRDDKMFEIIQRDPVLNQIVGPDHATHPPCSYYIKNRDLLMDIDGTRKPKDVIQIRRKKITKPKLKKKCRCK